MFNSIAEEGQAAIRVVSTSQHGLTRKLLAPFDISAGVETSKTIPIVDLGLSTEVLDYSGVLRVAAKVTLATGAEDDTADRILYFHPEAGGWRVYDQVTRDRDFERGALTAEAAAHAQAVTGQPIADPEFPDHVIRQASAGPGFGMKLSDRADFVPSPDLDEASEAGGNR